MTDDEPLNIPLASVAEVEMSGPPTSTHLVDVVEYDETGVTFFLPNDFDHEVELDFSAALPIEIAGETNPPAVAGTAQDVAQSSAVTEHSASSIIESLSPMPKIQKVRPRTRKAQTAAVITSSPYKAELQKKQEMVANKIRKKMDKGKPSTKRGKAKKPRKEEEQDETPCCICLKKYNAEPSGRYGTRPRAGRSSTCTMGRRREAFARRGDGLSPDRGTGGFQCGPRRRER